MSCVNYVVVETIYTEHGWSRSLPIVLAKCVSFVYANSVRDIWYQYMATYQPGRTDMHQETFKSCYIITPTQYQDAMTRNN
jgi:hypothetical protein